MAVFAAALDTVNDCRKGWDIHRLGDSNFIILRRSIHQIRSLARNSDRHRDGCEPQIGHVAGQDPITAADFTLFFDPNAGATSLWDCNWLDFRVYR